ncbi:hypothetical protein [Duganella aceris]|uniref:Uncharacterized protein n=1 Tax=Duganella aceris TaxID=2703883 RepID=A0ABX0FT30_9BURK|nr:hypothetical protein [Duganella aceris]NGZ87607.1 hypothetical protein [Duganella aceris]
MNLKIENKMLTEATLAKFAPKKNGDGDGADFASMLKHAEVKQSESASQLEQYMKMTPAQRMAASIMKSMGITQAEFDAMSPEQQAAVTAKIAEIMKQQMDEQMAAKQAGKSSPAL